MVTQEERDLEEVGTLQIKAMREVLRSLKVLAGVDELPEDFYWFRYVDYVNVDRHGNLETWSRGYGNDPDSRAGYDLVIDEQLLRDRDLEAYRARFRAKQLPAFNLMRTKKREQLLALQERQAATIRSLEGDIS